MHRVPQGQGYASLMADDPPEAQMANVLGGVKREAYTNVLFSCKNNIFCQVLQ